MSKAEGDPPQTMGEHARARIPELEKQIRDAEDIDQGDFQLLRNRVTEDEIAEVVSSVQAEDPAPAEADAEDGVFDTFAEISEAGTVFGRVEVGLSVEAVRRVIADARRYGVTIALIEMGLVALFSFFLGVYLTRQLANLTEASERIARGDWDYRVPIHGNDELAATARAFTGIDLA